MQRKSVNIAFVDFWDSFKLTDNFIYNALKEHFEVNVLDVKNITSLSDQVEYLFYGDFGYEHLKYSCIRIYYTGENIFPNFNECDYAIGFEYINMPERYIRFPLYLANYKDDFELAKNKHINIDYNLSKRNFCCMVVSNNWHCSNEREYFFHKLSGYKKVDSGGRYLNNINLPDGVPDKNKFQMEYKFSICFENSSSEGYCTEKILQGFAAKTIPIYWGDPSVASQFNSGAFINCHDFNSFDEVIEKIIEIDSSSELYLKMLSTPAFNENLMKEKQEKFHEWLFSIFLKKYTEAFQRKLYGLNRQKEEGLLKLLSIKEKYEFLENKPSLMKIIKRTYIFRIARKIKNRSKTFFNNFNKISQKISRFLYISVKKLRLSNKNPSVIASNCNDAYILHDLGLKFNSPFVNCWLKPHDFIKLMKSFQMYMEYELKFIHEENINYPVGMLKDIKIYFQHYKSENEAKRKWIERKSRINYNNLFIVFSDRDGCSMDDLLEFDNLPYANKVVFVHIPYPEIKSSFYIKGFENEESVGICSNFRNSYKKFYDDFDYVDWFNKGKK